MATVSFKSGVIALDNNGNQFALTSLIGDFTIDVSQIETRNASLVVYGSVFFTITMGVEPIAEHRVFTFSNGCYITAICTSRSSTYESWYYAGYNANDEKIWGDVWTPIYSDAGTTRYFTLCWGQKSTTSDNYEPLALGFWQGINGTHEIFYAKVRDQHVSGWYNNSAPLMINGSIQPTYNWAAWNYIRGNNGQYRANLTMLNQNSIPDDVSAFAPFSESDFSSISQESSIWNYFINASIGDEITVAWSGQCRLTLTVNNVVGQPNVKEFTFKFYVPLDDTPFATITDEIIYTGTDPGVTVRNYYLSWLYDEENQVAYFYPIFYMPQNSAYKYAHHAMTLTDNQMTAMYLWLMARDSGEGNPDNPYDTGSEDNGGNPSGYDGNQDDIVNITPPNLDATSSGLFTIYCPTDNQLQDIAAFLWSDGVIDNFKKYFNNFADNIIALYVLPYKGVNLPVKAFKVGRVVSDDTDLQSVEYVVDRFVTIDMGELTIGPRWDSYLDFSPYTKFNIYLPGIGVQALDADDLMMPLNKDGSIPSTMGCTIKLEYNMDLMTGILVCFVKINGRVKYQFSGKIGYQIPLTGETHRSLMQGFAMATAGLIGTLATGGAAAPFGAVAASAGIINAMKPDVYRGGNLSGDAASLCFKTPYLIRRMPNKPMLVDQQKFTGYQSYKTGLLNEFSGYTEVVDAHVEGISCTEEERELIMDWLRKGVIL